MTKKIGRNINTYDEVNAPLSIALNTTTYTDILIANERRIGYKITNDTAHDIFVKEQSGALPDQLDRGFKIFKRSSYESKVDNVPVGIISVKAASGSPSILVVEE